MTNNVKTNMDESDVEIEFLLEPDIESDFMDELSNSDNSIDDLIIDQVTSDGTLEIERVNIDSEEYVSPDELDTMHIN